MMTCFTGLARHVCQRDPFDQNTCAFYRRVAATFRIRTGAAWRERRQIQKQEKTLGAIAAGGNLGAHRQSADPAFRLWPVSTFRCTNAIKPPWPAALA